MGVNKVDAFGENLIDLTEDTVQESDLPKGVTAHNAAGERIVGSALQHQISNNAIYQGVGYRRIGEGYLKTPFSFILTLTKNYNYSDSDQVAVLFTLGNFPSHYGVTQLASVLTNDDIRYIRLVFDNDGPNNHFYIDFEYNSVTANYVGYVLTLLGYYRFRESWRWRLVYYYL